MLEMVSIQTLLEMVPPLKDLLRQSRGLVYHFAVGLDLHGSSGRDAWELLSRLPKCKKSQDEEPALGVFRAAEEKEKKGQ